MNVVKGSDLMLFEKSGEGQASKYKALAQATSCNLVVSASVLETSSKDTGKWASKQSGKLSWSATSENMYVQENYDVLLRSMISRTPLVLAFSIASNANDDSGKPAEGWVIGTGGYEGEAIITGLTANAPDSDNATYSVSLEGSGALIPRSVE